MSTRDRLRAAVAGHRLAVLAAAALFVFLPLVAGATGMRAKPLENRPLAEPPSLSSGWGVFDEASTYVQDHLPVRPAAVDVHSAVIREVFRQPPTVASVTVGGVAYPRVVQGDDGWLFYGGDFQSPCSPLEDVEATVDRLERLATILRSSGREVAVVVAPDKSSIVTERLPSRYIGRQCASARKEMFWQEYDARGGDLVDVRPALREAHRQPGGAYLRSDTHWTPAGWNAYASTLVDHLSPGLWDESALEADGTLKVNGDLAPYVLEERTDEVPLVSVKRPGVELVRQERASRHTFHYVNTTGGSALLLTGSTAMVGDSFMYKATPAWLPWFEKATTWHGGRSSRESVLKSIVSSRRVVFEVVERDASSGRLGMVDDAFVDQLEQRLASS